MKTTNDRIDELEAALMENYPLVDCPVTNSFVPGFYIRTVEMPAGAVITSMIHNTTHPYHITSGKALIKINDDDWDEIEAPFSGVTYPGTRRILQIVEDMVFTTFHPILDSEQPEHLLEEEVSEAVERIGKRILLPHENKLLGGEVKNNVIRKSIENDNVL